MSLWKTKIPGSDKTLFAVLQGRYVRFVREYTVYSGDWGEFQDMEVSWRDGDTLLINDQVWEINSVALSDSRNILDT